MRDGNAARRDGLLGLLIVDALGVPYEFTPPERVPEQAEIQLVPPNGFPVAYPHVPPGTWSDDGAQALCLLDSLLSCGQLDVSDFGRRLLSWLEDGMWTADGVVFDCGNQTYKALSALKRGVPPEQSGMAVPNGQGNGALMRVLPLALWHTGDDGALVEDAHRQAMVTHGHMVNRVCCAIYSLWGRYLLSGKSMEESHGRALAFLKGYYQSPDAIEALRVCETPVTPQGTGYVLDSLYSALHLMLRCSSYEEVVKGAISLGNDTDTTAAIAGGLAGIVFGEIPLGYIQGLRAMDMVLDLIKNWI